MIYTTLVITLEENAIFAKNLSPGNIYYTHDYIPGSVIWGHFATRFAREKPALFKKYFFSDTLIFTNLYPNVEANITALPMPLSTFACKYLPGRTETSTTTERHGFNDYLIDTNNLDKRCLIPNCRAKKKKLVNAFFYKKVQYFSYIPSKSIDMHNQIDDKRQSTIDDGLYTYEVLNKNQKFKGLILFDGDEIEFDDIRKDILCPDYCSCSIGKGRNNGYGKSYLNFVDSGTLDNTRVVDLLHADACKQILTEREDHFTITLLSDVILRDSYSNYLTSINEHVLCSLLPDNFNPRDFKLIRGYSECIEIDGYNMKHQKPKNKCIAMKKGSAFYFRYGGDNRDGLSKALLLLESRGIGERKNEGFGMITVNLQYHFDNQDQGTI